MSYTASNVNYGYAVATNKTFVAISNPSAFVYLNDTPGTGSVEVLQYSNNTDSYIHNSTIYKYLNPDLYLSSETSDVLLTEKTESILLDYTGLPISASKFGQSVALYNTTLIVGDPLFYYKLTDVYPTVSTGSSVDIFNISTTSSYSYVTTIANIFESNYDYNTSFGESVSIYNDIIAIGASSISSSKGVVYLYKKVGDTWTYYQSLTGSNVMGSKFGGTVKIDQSGNYNIIVGNKAISGSVYLFNYDSSSGYWTQAAILNANRTLTSSLENVNNNWPPYITASTNADGYGNSVAIYGNNIIVGAPTDTCYAEYIGSNTWHRRGAAYFYENCIGDNKNWILLNKSFGSDAILTDNYFGWDVEIYNTSSIVSSLKTNFPFSSSYLQNTLYKKFDCNPNDYIYDIIGQYVLYEKNTDNSTWNIKTTVTKKKQYGEPYSVYGFNTSLYDTTIVVGSPTIYTGSI